MPPLTAAEDYVDLLTAIEDTAKYLEMPVVIEGYTPPDDPRFRQIKVTPDPGVIEVNVQPAANWQELVSNTTALYDDARQSRLGAEKFMLDGRHTGTGGGNHFVLGGPTPADSRFPAPAGPAAQHDRILAESSCALVRFLGHVHRANQPGSARGRNPRRQPLRTGDRVQSNTRSGAGPGSRVAGGSDLAPHSGGRHRQHASRRVLYRQAIFAGFGDRPPGPAGTARF